MGRLVSWKDRWSAYSNGQSARSLRLPITPTCPLLHRYISHQAKALDFVEKKVSLQSLLDDQLSGPSDRWTHPTVNIDFFPNWHASVGFWDLAVRRAVGSRDCVVEEVEKRKRYDVADRHESGLEVLEKVWYTKEHRQ